MPKKKPFIFNPHDNLLRTGVSESTNIDISMDGLGNLMKQYGRMPHINDPLYSRLAKDSFKQIPISATPINRDLYDTEFNKKWVNSKMFNDLALASKQNNSYTEAMRKQGNKDHPIFMTTDSRLIGNMDYQNPEMKALAINPSGIKNLQDGAYLDPSNDHINSTITHELSHAVDGDGKYISPQSQSLMQASLLPNPALSDTRYKYLSTPTEIRARLNTLRYESQNDKSFDVFNTPFKKNNLEKLKNSQSYRELRAIYDDTSILKLLNSVAKNDNNHIPMARNGINYNRAVLGADVLGLGTNSFKNGGGNDEWEVIDDTKVKFGNGGKDDFYNSLLQGPKPITDKGNFSNIQYTQSQSNTLQNVKKAQYKIAKTQLQDEQRARAVKEKNAPYAFPDGNTKTWEQMSDHEKGFINAQSLRNKGRWNENEVNQPFLNMFNPVTMLYDMAAGIGDAGYQSEQQNSVLPYVTGVGAPLLTGALAGLGTQSSGQFVNNLANPLAGTGSVINNLGNKYFPKAFKPLPLLNPFTNSTSRTASNLNLEELRRVYHNSERIMRPEELRFLREHGHGSSDQYQRAATDYVSGSYRGDDVIDGIPPPPHPPGTQYDEFGQPVYNYNELNLRDDISYMANGLPARYYPHLNREQNIVQQELIRLTDSWQIHANPVQTAPTPKIIKNKSGLTKEEVLQKTADNAKDIASKMSETEFENTVLKPTGEIAAYKPGPEIEQMTYDLANRQMVLKGQIPMTQKEYVDAFNGNIDLLNDMIAKKNKSGVDYEVKRLDENGRLVFHTPEQTVVPTLTDKQKANIEWINRDAEDWLINKGGLRQEAHGWVNADGDVFNSKEEALSNLREAIAELTAPKTISGESIWSVNINPGQWKGDVEDIANTDYFRSIPGLEMSNSSLGVFSDNIARKGTGAYESLNDYLKTLDLGRVKPGFNSQTEFSRGAWESFIKSGRGVGFYGNPKTVYGSMKSIFPYVIPTIGAGMALQEKQNGGLSDEWEIIE